MTIGNRIRLLRKKLNYSQEYLAEQLNISRQAVSKWEQDISSPDTGNLILLASVLHTTVEYIASGEESNIELSGNKKEDRAVKKKITSKQKKRIAVIACLSVSLIGCLGIAIFIHTRPVAWDSGACGGGYATYIFDKYSEDLLAIRFGQMEEDKEKITSMKAIRGSQSAEWKERKMYLQFDIEYEHKEQGIITETVRFIGTRYWIEAFKWRGAIIVG